MVNQIKLVHVVKNKVENVNIVNQKKEDQNIKRDIQLNNLQKSANPFHYNML